MHLCFLNFSKLLYLWLKVKSACKPEKLFIWNFTLFLLHEESGSTSASPHTVHHKVIPCNSLWFFDFSEVPNCTLRSERDTVRLKCLAQECSLIQLDFKASHFCPQFSAVIFLISCSLLFSSYVTNTCVDSPHDKKIVAIQFQPQQKRDESTPPLAMTAGKDGKFKIWLLAEETAIKGTCVCKKLMYRKFQERCVGLKGKKKLRPFERHPT